MAISSNLLSQYATTYAGSDHSAKASKLGASIGRAIGGVIPNADEKLAMAWSDHFGSVFNEAFQVDENNPENWNVNLKSKDDMYTEWEMSLSARQKKQAKRRGMLNPIAFAEEYEKYKSNLALNMQDKLRVYKTLHDKDDDEMSDLLASKPEIRKLLIERGSLSNQDGTPSELANYIMPAKTILQKWGDAAEGFADWGKSQAEPGKAIRNTALVTAGYLGRKQIGAGAKWLKDTAKSRFGSAANETVKQKAKSKTSKKIAKSMIGSVVSKLQKHGPAKITQHIAKKLGWKIAGRTIAKLGLGALGAVATGGAITAAMLAWSAKDLYDIAKVVEEMDAPKSGMNEWGESRAPEEVAPETLGDYLGDESPNYLETKSEFPSLESMKLANQAKSLRYGNK